MSLVGKEDTSGFSRGRGFGAAGLGPGLGGALIWWFVGGLRFLPPNQAMFWWCDVEKTRCCARNNSQRPKGLSVTFPFPNLEDRTRIVGVYKCV